MDKLGWQCGVGFVESRQFAATVRYYSQDFWMLERGFFDIEGYPGEVG